MGLAKNGRAAAIRNFLREHPHSTAAQVAAGIGLSPVDVSKELSRMVRHGNIVAEKESAPGLPAGRLVNLVIAREPYDVKRKPPKPKPMPAFKRLGMQPATASARATATHAPKPAQPCQTVEDFLKAGGQVEVLPTHWEDFTRYPRVMGRTG